MARLGPSTSLGRLKPGRAWTSLLASHATVARDVHMVGVDRHLDAILDERKNFRVVSEGGCYALHTNLLAHMSEAALGHLEQKCHWY